MLLQHGSNSDESKQEQGESMKLLNFCIALIISLGVGLTTVPADSFAKDTAKETTASKLKSSTSKSTKAVTSPVNINTASKADLQLLPGVGPVTADAIIAHRKANGKFKSAKDLLSVKGIGEKTLKKMTPLLKF